MMLTKTPSLLIIFISSFFSLTSAIDILTPSRPLYNNETLVSANHTFALGFFAPNPRNRYIGIWYNKISVQTVVWVANRNHPIKVDSVASLSIARNGILTITVDNSTAIWSSASPSGTASNPIAQILDTGNFVVRDADSVNSEFSYTWQSFDYPTDALLPGMKIGDDLKSGLRRNLTAWSSSTDPSSGPNSPQHFVDVHGDPQVFLSVGSKRTWRTGSWNGLCFPGIPEMATSKMFTFKSVQNSDEVYFAYEMMDTSMLSRIVVTPTDSVQRLIWNDQVKRWDMFWSKPKNQCDGFSACGPFGICNLSNSPVCNCVQGFVPRNSTNWALGDWSDGCIRKTTLDCRNGTDGFVTVSGAMLPDTSTSTLDWSLSLDQCKAKCLTNCLCTAYASADTIGTGCLIWTGNLTDVKVSSFGGQDLYVRLAAVDLGSTTLKKTHHSRILTAVVTTTITLGLLLLVWISCFCIRRKKRQRFANLGTISLANTFNNEGEDSQELKLPLFNFSTITIATGNFSTENKLGEGGFGPVFKGILEDGQEIAVKRLAKSSDQGIDEFKNEMILIAKLQHRNLVRLLGCCVHGEERMLVYEYMPNKSLDVFLFNKEKGRLLDWKTRQQIILGIIRGLLYLHHDSRLRVIHRDLKASNILLDMEMNPKISDFGMARIFGGNEKDFKTRKVVGTYGYMSPEYAMEGIFSVKSDVYSFGVLILEIISGRKNRENYAFSSHLNLVAHVWSLWNEDKGLQLVDEAISNFPPDEVLKYIKIGLLCVQEHPENRPLLSSVIQLLGCEITSLPQPKQPGFVSRFVPDEANSYLSEQGLASNEITVTILNGR